MIALVAAAFMGVWIPPGNPLVVTVDLTSPATTSYVLSTRPVEWTITALAPDADNLGLAAVVVDLVQDTSNPAVIDLLPAVDVPAAMAGFSRPAGISNPNVGGVPGYCGTPTGPAGAKNLIQIGGVQNTFGVAGALVGQDTSIETGLGQDVAGQLVASGSFNAPTVAGLYTVRLESARVNLLSVVNAAPGQSLVTPATVILGSITFEVRCLSDFNADMFVDAIDYDLFLIAWVSLDPSSDLNGDDFVDAIDLDLFIAAFFNGC